MLVMVKTSMFKRYANMATRAWRIPQLIRNIYTTRVSAVGKNITVPLPLPDKLHDLIYAFRESKVLFAACDLGIFDILQDFDAPQSVADMSSKIGSNADATACFQGRSYLYANTQLRT